MALLDHDGGFDQSPEELPLLSEPLLTADDAADLLRIRRCTVYELARNRRLPHVRVGRRILFVRADLAAWVVANRVSPRP
jgi:excisionase family DNA binding protein